MAIIFKGDIGTKIKLNAGTDISNATVCKIKYRKPGGATGEWDAIIEDTNYAYYVIQDGDLDVAGTWKIQLYIDLGSWKGYGSIVGFMVRDTL